MDMQWIWLGVIVSLLLIEAVSMNFTSIWFVVSGIVSIVLAKLEKDYMVQVLSFLIIGFLFITILRPKIIGNLNSKRDKIIDKMIAKHPFFIHLVPHDLRNNVKNKKKG